MSVPSAITGRRWLVAHSGGDSIDIEHANVVEELHDLAERHRRRLGASEQARRDALGHSSNRGRNDGHRRLDSERSNSRSHEFGRCFHGCFQIELSAGLRGPDQHVPKRRRDAVESHALRHADGRVVQGANELRNRGQGIIGLRPVRIRREERSP